MEAKSDKVINVIRAMKKAVSHIQREPTKMGVTPGMATINNENSGMEKEVGERRPDDWMRPKKRHRWKYVNK